MLADTKGFHQEHVGKRLRIDLTSGEVDEIKLLDVTACDPPQAVLRDHVHRALHKSQRWQQSQGGTYWTAFGEIDKFPSTWRLKRMQPFSTHSAK